MAAPDALAAGRGGSAHSPSGSRRRHAGSHAAGIGRAARPLGRRDAHGRRAGGSALERSRDRPGARLHRASPNGRAASADRHVPAHRADHPAASARRPAPRAEAAAPLRRDRARPAFPARPGRMARTSIPCRRARHAGPGAARSHLRVAAVRHPRDRGVDRGGPPRPRGRRLATAAAWAIRRVGQHRPDGREAHESPDARRAKAPGRRERRRRRVLERVPRERAGARDDGGRHRTGDAGQPCVLVARHRRQVAIRRSPRHALRVPAFPVSAGHPPKPAVVAVDPAAPRLGRCPGAASRRRTGGSGRATCAAPGARA